MVISGCHAVVTISNLCGAARHAQLYGVYDAMLPYTAVYATFKCLVTLTLPKFILTG
jgi:hypothetical protein